MPLSKKYLEELNTVFSQAPVSIRIIAKKNYVIDYANDYYLHLVDQEKSIMGKPLFEVFPELISQGIKEIIDNVFETGILYESIEHQLIIQKGDTTDIGYFNLTYKPIKEQDGTFEKLILVATNVTEQVVSRKKCEDAEFLYQEMIYSSPSMIAIFKGEEMIIKIANDAILESWGKGKDIVGKSLFEVLPEIIEQGFDKLLLNVYKTGEPFHAYEMPINLVRNGKSKLVFYTFTYQAQRNNKGEIDGVSVIANEVTPQAIFHKKLKENEEQFRMIAELMPSKISNADAAGSVTYFNQNWLDYAGMNFEDLRDFGYHKIMHPDEIEEFQKRFQHAAETGTVLEMEMRFLNLEGEYLWHLNLASPVKDENGKIKMWIGSTTEIQKIKESEIYFRQIAEAMLEKVTNASPDGTIVYYNKSWQDYTGASVEELINEGWGKWMHEDEMAETSERWQKSVETGADFDMVLRMLNHKGEYRWHKSSARAVKDEDGKTKLWIGFNSDIHDQKLQKNELEEMVASRTYELEKANVELIQKNEEIAEGKAKLLSEYARSLIEASLDPLITISREGKITDLNDAFAKITGKTHIELVGTDFTNYFTDPKMAQKGYQEIFKKGFVIDYPLTIKDHKLTDVLFNGSVYKDEKGNILGAVVVSRDITEQKKIERELNEAKLFAELATSIAEEAKVKAESATLIAENAVKSKQQFLANMSHEIRTPMNAIIGFTRVVLKTDLSTKQKEYINAIKLSGDAMIVLINDILDLAKVDAGKMQFEQTPFKLKASISAMLHLFETKIQEKNLRLIKEYDQKIPEVLLGDSVRLHQIILNLVSNAVKFTNEGTITLSIKLLKEDDQKVSIEFAVIDTGIGINKEKIEAIFENFQQATSETTRLYGGTGLGLAIAKQLIEGQGGIISVKSEINEGSTFSFALDFQKAKTETEIITENIELDKEIKNIKVLVAEDMALNQLLMRTLLDDFGFECEIADNGKIAVEKLEKSKYDIILMDLQMPEMNGFEATEYIRNTLKSNIPIIALTADVTTVDVEKCKAVGMNDYVSKPVDEKILYNKIVGLLKKSPLLVATEAVTAQIEQIKLTNLSYLNQRTKSNPKMMMEMISVYLEQTPPLINTMKQSLLDKDWVMLNSAVHKMLPSFAIMGMSTDFENVAKKIQEYASTLEMTDKIHDLVVQLENACTQACKELEEEFHKINTG